MPTAASEPALTDALRSQLAQELHDELGSVLTAARLDVAWLRSQRSPSRSDWCGRLQRLETLLKEGQAELRRVVQGLHPAALEQFGLPVAIEALARDFATRFAGEMTIVVNARAQLDGAAALALYRCAQECLTNLHRHADARKASLQLQCIKGRIRLRIEDDGHGFRVDQVAPGHEGLQGMRARLRAVNGHLRIDSSPKAGTRITASVQAPTRH
jgi:signal transduction histidine kinase